MTLAMGIPSFAFFGDEKDKWAGKSVRNIFKAYKPQSLRNGSTAPREPQRSRVERSKRCYVVTKKHFHPFALRIGAKDRKRHQMRSMYVKNVFAEHAHENPVQISCVWYADE
jgi:hypothetical protein